MIYVFYVPTLCVWSWSWWHATGPHFLLFLGGRHRSADAAAVRFQIKPPIGHAERANQTEAVWQHLWKKYDKTDSFLQNLKKRYVISDGVNEGAAKRELWLWLYCLNLCWSKKTHAGHRKTVESVCVFVRGCGLTLTLLWRFGGGCRGGSLHLLTPASKKGYNKEKKEKLECE